MNVLERPGIPPIVEHFGGLPTQPKREIAEYVGSMGVAVPDLFTDLEAARDSGEPFIARSENPYELFYSGLSSSVTVTSSEDRDFVLEDLQEAEKFLRADGRTFHSLASLENPLRNSITKPENWRRHIFGGPAFGGEASDAFARLHSLSYWRHEPGNNLYMIADSGRPGRYYLGNLSEPTGYAVVEDGKLIEKGARRRGGPHQFDWTREPEKLIDFYEKVRSLPAFDAQNAPLIELVNPGKGKEPVFLQILPTQQQQATNFIVDRPTESTFFVRGTTPEEGFELLLRMQVYGYDHNQFAGRLAMSAYCFNEAETEAYLPEASLHIQPENLGHATAAQERAMYLCAALDHGSRSTLFKPLVTVGLTKEAADRIRGERRRQGPSRKVFVRSDGERAYLEYYDDDERRIVAL